ncbi:MAG: hypothetical protein N2439_05730, partial [Anaerolineae bacterium]|nr:hypothetical protein [Anaerolineae bacterium]
TGEMGTHRDGLRTDGNTGEAGNRAPAQAIGTGSDADHGACHEAGEETDAHETAGARDRGDTVSGQGDAGSPHSSTHSGGSHLDEMVAAAMARDRRDAVRVADALRRIIAQTCAIRGQASPRIDGRALVTELVSRRTAIHRARRRESEIRDLVIAVDESGSCVKTVAATYAAALSVARILPADRVSVITHSNGYEIRQPASAPCAPWLASLLRTTRGLGAYYFSATQRNASEFAWESIARRRPGLVLMIGDSDANWAAEIIHAAGVRVTMLAWCLYDAPYQVIGPVHDLRTAADALSGRRVQTDDGRHDTGDCRDDDFIEMS